MGHPFPLAEIYLVEAANMCGPVSRCAAEAAKSADLKGCVALADHLPCIQTLGRRIGTESTALDHRHPFASPCKASCNRDSGGPGPDDAQIGLNAPIAIQAAGVNEH